MFCMQCGTQLPDTAQFCYACGKEIAIPQQTSTNKPQEPVIPDAVMDDIARKAAAEIGKNPVLRFRFLLENLEETATKGDFTASTLKQTFDLTDELNEITDTRILHDPEIKRLLPVLTDITKGWVIWMTLKSRWEEDTKQRKPRVVIADFQEIANVGLAGFANRVGINKSDVERFGIGADNPGRFLIDIFTPYPQLTVWLQLQILRNLFYFLLKQGYNIGKSPQLAGVKKIFGAEFVDDVIELAQRDYAEERGKN